MNDKKRDDAFIYGGIAAVALFLFGFWCGQTNIDFNPPRPPKPALVDPGCSIDVIKSEGATDEK